MPGQRPRVLVVDDEEVIQDLLQDILSTADIPVEVVSNGQLALEALERQAAPLVFCDLGMPGLSGAALVRRLRETAPDASVVMMSGNIEDDAIRLALEAGASEALQKPFHLNDILEICRRHLPGS